MSLSFRLQYVFVHLGKGVSEAVSLLFHPVEHSFRKLHQGILVLTLPVPGKGITCLSGMLLGQASCLFEAPGLTNKSESFFNIAISFKPPSYQGVQVRISLSSKKNWRSGEAKAQVCCCRLT